MPNNVIDSIQLSGVQYTLSAQTSGGTTYSAGRAIDITNDTISLDLPISAGTGSGSIIENNPINIASGTQSHAEGSGTTASGNYAHAEGSGTTAQGTYSHTEGYRTYAKRPACHAEGNRTSATTDYSHAEGILTLASGTASHAEGNATSATSQFSHAEGNSTTASGTYGAHAEGKNTKAEGQASHAEGYDTYASGNYSHTEGYGGVAYGHYTHVEGYYTYTRNQSEHASGQYNVSSSASTTFGDSGNTLFSVGNGTASDARHNAFEIRENADIYITLNGQDVKLQDYLGGSSGNPTVELTQAEYDALVSAGTVAADTYYIITDATPIDVSTFVTSGQMTSAITQATSGKVNTSSVVSSVTSASTDSEIPTAKAVYDAIPTGGTGGGKAISAGTNISVTTGETADTINCTLPFSHNTSPKRIVGNSQYSLLIGKNNNASTYAQNSLVVGENSSISNGGNINCAVAIGYASTANTSYSTAVGSYVKTNNSNELSTGNYNVSNTGSTTADKTLFSVGNGTADNARHNAFEIRQNGDIYLNDGTNDVKLQDTIIATAANTTALGGLSLVKLTQAQYDALATKDSNVLYVIVG